MSDKLDTFHEIQDETELLHGELLKIRKRFEDLEVLAIDGKLDLLSSNLGHLVSCCDRAIDSVEDVASIVLEDGELYYSESC